MSLDNFSKVFSGWFQSSDAQDQEPELVEEAQSHVIWTGPSVRLRDGEDLLSSQEVHDDLEAIRRLREQHVI
ncbi:hypothetical protein [Marinobacter alexandrii]|jgi:hypothetical protein|uniref:hypothetical protein n=1 Tax=Marinobacter alexandrii TaxID=2570351 RepID=UPI002ABDD8B2|nr:hypothetical protein [Marinobacter alexandrii]